MYSQLISRTERNASHLDAIDKSLMLQFEITQRCHNLHVKRRAHQKANIRIFIHDCRVSPRDIKRLSTPFFKLNAEIQLGKAFSVCFIDGEFFITSFLSAPLVDRGNGMEWMKFPLTSMILCIDNVLLMRVLQQFTRKKENT